MEIISGILVFTAALLLLVYYYIKQSYNYWKIRNVPYQEPNFFFGNLLAILHGHEHSGKYIARLYNEFKGPYFGFYAFTKPILVIKDLEIIKMMLVKDFHIFPNRFHDCDEKIDFVISNSLFGIKVPHWKSLRAKLSPIFSSFKIKSMMLLMKECGNGLQEYLGTVLNETVDIKDLAQRFTTDVIMTCAFGINANSFKTNSTFLQKPPKRLLQTLFGAEINSLSYFFAPALIKLFKLKFFEKRNAKMLSDIFIETINDREIKKFKRNDLVDILINIKNEDTDDDKYKFYGKRVTAQAIMFFFAGHETTSSTIAYTLHELCINDNIQSRLRKEIQEVIQKHGDLSYEALADMKYLHMVVSETLRKYAVTPFLSRHCIEDYVISKTGLVIEKGTCIFVPQQGLHWDAEYFPNPEKYDPERFSDENKHNIIPYSYMPFGHGPRNCIGERFGLISLKLGLIYILKNFKVEKSPRTREPIIFEASSLLRPKGGIPLILRKL